MNGLVHASAAIIGETGVLVRGASGSGKSRLVLALIAEAGLRGQFARLVGDDRVDLANAAGRLVVCPHPAIAGRIERRGQAIARLPHEPAAVVGLVVDLVAAVPRLPDGDEEALLLFGVRLARLAIWQEAPAQEAAAAVFWALQERPQGYKV